MKFIFNLLVLAGTSALLLQCADNTSSGNASVNPKDTTEIAPKTTSEPPSATSDQKRIVFFGNSLTAAYGLDPAQGFPALIQDKLDALGYDYEVINAGVSGETSAGGLGRVDWILKNPVDIFVLELGANDGLRGIDPQSTHKNLQAIIDKVKDNYPEAKIVIAGMLAPPNMGPKFTKAFQQIYPDLASKNDAALIPFLLLNVAGEPTLNLPDGIHPTAEGQKIVAKNVWEVLQGVVR